MEIITISLDIIIVLLSLWVLYKLVGYGGEIGRSLSSIGYGIIIIGISQFIETFGFVLLKADINTIEILHRILLTLGFIIIGWGFKNLMQKK